LTPGGCTDTVNVFVEQFEQAEITSLAPFYCFKDSVFQFDVYPDNGTWDGALVTNELNPALLGEGNYEVIYEWEGQLCSSADTASFEIYPELMATLTASDTVLCGGQGALLTVTASGGNPNANYIYQWSDGGFPIATHTASPASTTTITVTVSDGCSDEAVNEVLLTVLPDIEITITTTDTLCFGETGAISATVSNVGNFEYNWNGTVGPTIEANAGATQYLTVTDLDNGCEVDTFAVVPSYPPISAAFSINPNSGCVSFDERTDISFIDLSNNAVAGNWDFGNGQFALYVPGSTPDQAYPSAGNYTITLVVQNVGGCADTATASLCILPEVPLFIPDIFSPNGDGRNDVFYLRGHGVSELEFFVWSRWGELVFSSRDINQGWDGTINGKPQPSGNYIYNIRAVLSDGTEQELKGEVALIR
jgi:gliding motility-associated-like protein